LQQSPGKAGEVDKVPIVYDQGGMLDEYQERLRYLDDRIPIEFPILGDFDDRLYPKK